jgi:hypothetical protein
VLHMLMRSKSCGIIETTLKNWNEARFKNVYPLDHPFFQNTFDALRMERISKANRYSRIQVASRESTKVTKPL